MGAFEYTALDTAGREQNGVVEGDTVKHVRQILRDRQLLPVEVAEVKHGEAKRDRSSPCAVAYRPPTCHCSPVSSRRW